MAGTIAILGGGLMAVLGVTRFASHLQGRSFVVYWSWCFLLAVAAILLAMVDLWLLRRAYRQSRRDLFAREFMTKEFSERFRTKQQENRPR